jgi:hypothetical protein
VLCNNFSFRSGFPSDGEEVCYLAANDFDAQEIEDNIQVCEKILNQILDEVVNTEEDGEVYEHKIDCSMHFLESFNNDVFVEDHDPLLQKKFVVPNFLTVDFQDQEGFSRSRSFGCF